MNRATKREIHTAQFSDSFPPIMDGVARVALEYAEHVQQRLGPTHIIVPAVPGYADEERNIYRYPSVPIPGREPYRFGVPWVLPGFTRKLSGLPLELVHSHSPFVAGSLALQVARSRQIPVVTTFHTKYLDDVRSLFPKFNLPVEIVRRHIIDFYNRVDQVWVPNSSTGETLREYGYEGPIEVVEHGTDIRIPVDVAAARRRAEEFLGLGPNDRLLLYLGQIKFEKNLVFVLKSLKALAESGGRFRFAFVGEGYAQPELERTAAEFGLTNVQFPGVVRDRDLIVSLLSRAELLVFPSRYDTAGLVIKEAAALGVPSVLLKGSNAAEGVRDGQNGFVVDEDPTVYAALLQKVLNDPELRNRAGAGARKTLYRSWSEVADEVAQRYLDLIAATRRSIA